MRTALRTGALALVLLLGILLVPPSGGASAAPRGPRTPATQPGWVTSRVRFEPVDPAANLAVDGVGEHRGAYEVVASPGGGVAVVNEVSLEEYLYGISEVPVSWPAAAQQAQAIAARTYLLHELARGGPPSARAVGADICATDACQVYTGLAKERREGAHAWTAAVQATERQVLLHGGRPILAKYSSTNGGRTVAGGKPYLRAVDDPDDAASPLHRWRSAIPLAAVASALGLPDEPVTARRDGDSVTFELPARPAAAADPEGAEAATPADGGAPVGSEEAASPTRVALPAADVRLRLNDLPAPGELPLTVPSIRYTLAVDQAARALVVDGRGWGHGIGMSQWGAYGKARRGMATPDILAFYYGGIRPTTVAPDAVPARVRVAVDLGRASAAVQGTGLFRAVDGDGRPLAVATGGRWQVLPAPGGKVRVVPPPEATAPLALEPLGTDPGAPDPGAPVGLRLRLSAPAVLRLTITPPGGQPLALEPRLVGAGDTSHPLPALPEPGDYVVQVEAEAGVGRTASLPVVVTVADPTPEPAAGDPAAGDELASASASQPLGPGDGPSGALTGLALVLLLAAAVGVSGRLLDGERPSVRLR